MQTQPVPDFDHLKRAYEETARVTQITPLLRARALEEKTGARRVFVKPESLQWTNSFKVRGAYWRLCNLSPEAAAKGVVAHSSGNFAQGLAAAGAALGVPVTVVMPHDAPAAKRDATAAHGARVVLTEHGPRPRGDVAAERSRAIADEEGLTLLHPFDDPLIVAGQAGVGLEAIGQLEAAKETADSVLCPVGGGGLIAGITLAFAYSRPGAAMWAVEPEDFDSMGQSLAAGAQRTAAGGGATICDGLMSPRPGDAPFAAIAGSGMRAVTVDDHGVRAAMRFAADRLKLVLEPSGAATIAALSSGKIDVKGKSVLLIASGGNISYEDFARHVANV